MDGEGLARFGDFARVLHPASIAMAIIPLQ